MTLIKHTVDTTVGRLHVEIDGTGPPAVLWHSLFVDSTTFSALRARLRGERRLLVIDGPGHGQSGQIGAPPNSFTLDDCAAAAGDVLDALAPGGPVDWVGNAWGGHVGLTLAATAPGRLRSLVIVATPVAALSRRERIKIVPMVAAYRFVGAAAPLADAVARALLGDTFLRSRPEETARVIRSFRAAPRTGMHRAMTSMMLHRPSLEPLLARITTPTLMAVTTDDPLLPAEQIHNAAAQMRCAAVIDIDGEGHVAPLIAQADPLAAIIREFWRDPLAYIAADSR